MKLILLNYKENQLEHVETDYDPKTLDLEFVDFKYTKPVHLSGEVEKGEEILSFRGTLSAEVGQMCGRCLEVTNTIVKKPFDLFYEIKGKAEIETLDDLREILILEHPITFLCSESCKGLCPNCGINLNTGSCKCRLTNPPESLSSWKQEWMKKYGGNK